MTTFDDLPDAPESPPGSHTVHKETRDELRHLVNEAMRHSQAKAATAQAMEQAERASELTRPLEALAARLEIANHRLENLPAIIHQIVKQTATDTSTDQLQTIMEALGKPDGKSIAEDMENLNATVVTCLDTVSAGLRELPTRQEVDRRLGAVDGFLNKQRDIIEAEVEGVTRTVQSVAEKVDAATGDVKGQVIGSANDIKESIASMADMISGVKNDVTSVKDEVTGMRAAMTGMGDLALGVKSEETLAEKVARLRGVLIAVRRDVDFALEGYDSRVKDATTSQVKKRVEFMQQIVDGYPAHLASPHGNYENRFSTLIANHLELRKIFGAMKNEVEQLGKLVPDIVDMREKVKIQARRICVLEEDVKTLNNTIMSKKWSENRQVWRIDQMRQKEQAQAKLIAGMQQKVDSQATFIVNLQRKVDYRVSLIANLRAKVNSQATFIASLQAKVDSQAISLAMRSKQF